MSERVSLAELLEHQRSIVDDVPNLMALAAEREAEYADQPLEQSRQLTRVEVRVGDALRRGNISVDSCVRPSAYSAADRHAGFRAWETTRLPSDEPDSTDALLLPSWGSTNYGVDQGEVTEEGLRFFRGELLFNNHGQQYEGFSRPVTISTACVALINLALRNNLNIKF